ncbi:MAG: hypothetical protein EA411_02855 [Saprospirales bacterium]|nr:MAG: hypothetical protein EA411_02855 [Saprospirales bacterium]
MAMQGQDCIDIRDIEIELATIVDKCSCTDPLILGEPGKTTHISTYQFNILLLSFQEELTLFIGVSSDG